MRGPGWRGLQKGECDRSCPVDSGFIYVYYDFDCGGVYANTGKPFGVVLPRAGEIHGIWLSHDKVNLVAHHFGRYSALINKLLAAAWVVGIHSDVSHGDL